MSMSDRDGFIWLDGELVPWREAKVHVLTHTLHYLPSMNKLIACLGASAVGLGALGAHTLALYLDKSSIESFKTAVFVLYSLKRFLILDSS